MIEACTTPTCVENVTFLVMLGSVLIAFIIGMTIAVLKTGRWPGEKKDD